MKFTHAFHITLCLINRPNLALVCARIFVFLLWYVLHQQAPWELCAVHRDLQTVCIKSFVRLIKKRELIHANRNKHRHIVPLEGVFLPRHPSQFPWCCIPSAHASFASFPHWSKPTNSYRQDDWLLMWSSYSMPCSVRASWIVLHSIHRCSQKHRHACAQSRKRRCKVQIKYKGPWMCRKNVLKEKKNTNRRYSE